MQTVLVRPKSKHVGEQCMLCPRQIKAGEAIIVDVVAQIRFGSGRTRRHHVRCMRELVNRAPAGIDELAECRAEMVAAADAFA